jgi:HK97 family phage major capsid protein
MSALATTVRGPRTLIQKADIALSDLISDGGYLNPAQAQEFIRLAIKQSVLLSRVRVIPMRSHTQELDQIKFGSRVLKPGTCATELDAGDRTKPDLSQVVLSSQLFKAEVHLDDCVVEDNIENGNFPQTVMTLMAERVGLDIEEVIANGDTSLGVADPLLDVLDGVRVQAVSNIHDFAGAGLNKDDLSDMLKTMPTRHRRRKSEMLFMTTHDAEEDYRNSLASRGTALGDAYVTEDRSARYSGIDILPVDVWPDDLGGSNDQTDIILTHPKNIAVGFWRQVKFETDRDIRAGKLIIVATVRFDVKYVEEDAVVKGINVQL